MKAEVELFDDWNAAARAGADALDRRPLLFERLRWFRLIAAHCPPPGKLLVARAGGTWLLLAAQGRNASAFTRWYSLRFPARGAGLNAIAAALRSRLAKVELAPLDDPAEAQAAFRGAGWIVSTEPATASWRADTSGLNFAAFWARRPSKLRNTARRKAKAAGLETEIHTRFDPAAWADYQAVYEASWKPEEGAPAFLRALAEMEGPRGTLRLGLARKDGRAVAAQLWLVEDGTAWIHKLAYREDAKDLSPGTILSMAMFRHALDEDQVGRIDYGTGDEPYKRDWMDERQILWRLTAYNRTSLHGLIGAGRAAASALVRRLRKS